MFRGCIQSDVVVALSVIHCNTYQEPNQFFKW